MADLLAGSGHYSYYEQIGRKLGPDVVQEGTDEDGDSTRWSFSEIKSDSFHWKGELSTDKGATWRLIVEVFAHRIQATFRNSQFRDYARSAVLQSSKSTLDK